MKQTKNFLLMAAMLLCSISVSAEAVQIDGIWYNLVTKAKQAEVTGTKYTGSVTIPSTVTYDNVEYSVTSIGEYVFYNCSSLTAITIPGSITSIGDEAFYGCSGLTSITILDGVTSIGTSAFRKCSSLTSITIPESVTSFGESAFYGCKSLTSVHISSIEAWCNIAFGGFESNPFSYAHDLYLKGELVTDLMIPEGVTSIREFAFHNYCNLISITIPESVTEIGDRAFHSCSSLTSIIIPESVTSIGESAFYGCKSLTSISIPESMTSIGACAFYGCKSLTSIIIPEGVTNIHYDTFYGCKSLTSITIPEGVTTIGSDAFDGCKNLASIVLPKSIRYVSSEAFANCPELLNVYCNAESVPSTEADAFDGSYPEYATLYVPASAIENYKTTAPWSSFGKIAAIETSGIENADADAAYANPVIYDLSGRRMTHPEKGIYIIN